MAMVPEMPEVPGSHGLRETRSTARSTAAWVVAVLAGSAVLGLLGGLIWGEFAPRAMLQEIGAGTAQVINAETRAFFGADVWFCAIAVVAGLLTGVLGYRFAVAPRGGAARAAVAAALILGALAGALVMLWLGEQIGLSAYNHAPRLQPERHALLRLPRPRLEERPGALAALHRDRPAGRRVGHPPRPRAAPAPRSRGCGCTPRINDESSERVRLTPAPARLLSAGLAGRAPGSPPASSCPWWVTEPARPPASARARGRSRAGTGLAGGGLGTGAGAQVAARGRPAGRHRHRRGRPDPARAGARHRGRGAARGGAARSARPRARRGRRRRARRRGRGGRRGRGRGQRASARRGGRARGLGRAGRGVTASRRR